jgi:hypothetical protein
MPRLYRSIGLGGGGTRGGLHIGAIKAIQDFQGDLEFPDGIYGASVGAIMAAAVAFRVDMTLLKKAYDKYFTISSIIPKPTLGHVTGVFENRGLFSMDTVRDIILKVFDECGINLRGKKIHDAPQKLFIIASNMTTGRPTLLTGNVPILDALCCSSAIPLVYQPQVLFGDVYLDAGVHLRCIRSVVPIEALVIHISGKCTSITPESSVADILVACYSGKVSQYIGENMVRIRGVNFALLGELSQSDREYLVKEGYKQTLVFLTKRLAKEGL